MGMTLYGLQSMSDDNEEVRRLLKALEGKISGVIGPCSGRHVCNALFGMQARLF